MPATFSPVSDPLTPIEVTLGDTYTLTVTASGTDGVGLPLVLTSMTLTASLTHSSFTINNNSITITPAADLWDHYVSHVSKGSSDLLETPTIELIDDVPDNREVFKIDPDTTDPINLTVTAVANWDDGSSDTETYNIEIYNDLSFLGDWIQDYLENRY